MAETIRLRARDGHEFSAYVAQPAPGQPATPGGPPTGPRVGVVIVQEVFGVNSHIRSVADRFAAAGYLAVAPAVFDRLERGVDLGYTDEDLARGRVLRTDLGWEKPLVDIDAAREYAAGESGERRVGVVGFCWGGSLAWLSACRLPFRAATCYYGGQIAQLLDERPYCPVLMHFGRHDHIIPEDDQKRIMAAHPEVDYHIYEAGHGFNCDRREDFRQDCSDQAWERTMAFFGRHLG